MNNERILQGGLICDGSGGAPFRGDIHLKDGLIADIVKTSDAVDKPLPTGVEIFPAQDYIVTPGLIDLHAHVYDGMNLHSVSAADIGLKTGVTTLLDTGSAGAMNFGTFVKYVVPQARETIYALLNISCFGVQGHPEISPFIGDLHDTAHFDVPAALRCIQQYPELIVGVKVRLTNWLADNDPEKERAALKAVLQLRDESGLPLMVHHVLSDLPLDEVLPQLKAGDILTHFYQDLDGGGFTGEDGAPGKALLDARARGVVLDVGHGSNCFSWSITEPACTRHNFWPDVISSDLHVFNINGPVFDLATTMNKFLYLGMSLEDVVRATTSRAAEAMNNSKLGRLQVGLPADITVLKMEQGEHRLIDSDEEERIASQWLVPVCVFKNGEHHECQTHYSEAVA